MSDLGVILDLIPTPEPPPTTWGKVTDDSPLTVQLAGDTAGTEVELSAVRPAVGRKVLLQRVGGQWVCTHVIDDPGWAAASLLNSWAVTTGFDPRYRRAPDGVVFVEGALEKNPGNTAVMFTLPTGFRPERQHFFTVPTLTAGGYTNGQLLVEADGDVFLNSTDVAISGLTRVFIDLDFMAA